MKKIEAFSTALFHHFCPDKRMIRRNYGYGNALRRMKEMFLMRYRDVSMDAKRL